ncbi:MAG: serine hydrolase domain-containing protein [Flavobacterium sp.]
MKYIIALMATCLLSCSSENGDPQPDLQQPTALYFPPNGSNIWEASSLGSLGWNTLKAEELKTFLASNGTRAFIVLKDGKIVMEHYWGNNLTNTASFDQSKLWYWASAGKTLSAFLTGKAQEEGFLNIQNKTSDYLGTGWTSLTTAQENQIKVVHQLTMTTGLQFQNVNLNCTSPNCLTFRANAGSQWYYHNAPYTLLRNVVESATNKTYQQYTQEKLHQTIGMDGTWVQQAEGNVYYSTARSAARFGLMVLAKGKWNGNTVMNDTNYFNQMVSTSQNLNQSYGYLWWLNGKNSVIYPGVTIPISGSLAPNAPSDLVAAMGKNGQIVGVVASKNLVYVRFGEAPNDDLVPVLFHDQMWQKLKEVIGN